MGADRLTGRTGRGQNRGAESRQHEVVGAGRRAGDSAGGGQPPSQEQPRHRCFPPRHPGAAAEPGRQGPLRGGRGSSQRHGASLRPFQQVGKGSAHRCVHVRSRSVRRLETPYWDDDRVSLKADMDRGLLWTPTRRCRSASCDQAHHQRCEVRLSGPKVGNNPCWGA